MKTLRAILLTAAAALAQQEQNFSIVPPPSAPAQSPAPAPPSPEQQELISALNDANTSPVDIVRALEAHLKKYPNTAQRDDIEKAIAKASIDAKDDRRVILYGERALLKTPDDMLILDRVARALLGQGGRASADERSATPASATTAEPAAPPQRPQQPASLLVETPIRSGQSVVFPFGEVTVLGSVASGAEIVAGGSIHVYGALRGRAMAGSMGDAKARIYCSRNEAELLAIDGYYRTAEEMEESLRGGPVQVCLEGAVLKIAALDQ